MPSFTETFDNQKSVSLLTLKYTLDVFLLSMGYSGETRKRETDYYESYR